MGISLRVDQLNSDSHVVGRFLHATFKDVRNTKLLRDVAEIPRFALILLRGSTRNDFQVCDASQPRQDLLLNAVAEIGVIWIAAQILKWQHGNTFFRYDFARSAGDELALKNVGSCQDAGDNHSGRQRAVGKSAALLLFRGIDRGDGVVKLLLQRRGRLRTHYWIGLKHALDKIDNRARNAFQLIERQRAIELLLANFVTRAVKRQFAGQHEPER